MKERTERHQTGMKVIPIDVMFNDRFVFTLRYSYCPLFKLDFKDILRKIIEKRPSLKGKKIEIHID